MRVTFFLFFLRIAPAIFFTTGMYFVADAQRQVLPGVNAFADLAGTLAQRQGTAALSCVYNWGLGKQHRAELGVGVRLTGYNGSDVEFYTAPARLARTSTTPFLIFFAGHNDANVDTLIVQSPLTASLNISLNAGYHFTYRWFAGFNIDLVGGTTGRRGAAILNSNGLKTSEPHAKPTAFNVLLTGDNDRGALNSEFFVRYRLSGHWMIRVLYGFAFQEYQTTTVHQVAPDGTVVYRFRDKANLFGLGISYVLP